MEQLIETALEANAEDFEEVESSDDPAEIEVRQHSFSDYHHANLRPKVYLSAEYGGTTRLGD